jgi:chitin disaccharide deacetylase
MRKLVVVADDAGYAEERDRGIFLCVEGGVVKNVSLLVNFPGSARAAERLLQLSGRMELCVGLHLNFTEGEPCSTAPSSLTVEGGFMRGKEGFRQALHAGIIVLSDLSRELEAQMQAFHTLTGTFPTHMDSHQHIHVIPSVAQVIAPLLTSFGIRSVRLPQFCGSGALSAFLKGVCEQATTSKSFYEEQGLVLPPGFIGLDLMGNGDLRELRRALKETSSTDIEWMCHPGFVCESADEFSRSPGREHELALILSSELKQLLEDEGVQITSFHSLLPKALEE